MNRRLWIVIALVAASCAAPQPPEAWSVERVTLEDEQIVGDTICDEIREFALGSHVDDLGSIIDELARIAAVAGASAALPTLDEAQALATTSDGGAAVEADRRIARHELLAQASLSIDEATLALCEVPAFSAMYAASGFAGCHFEIDIPVAAYTTLNPASCDPNAGPDFLPCWSNDGNHLPVDCVTKLIVQTDGERWVPVGQPREIVVERGEPDDTPLVIAATNDPVCADLAALFTEGPIPGGITADYARLDHAARSLSAEDRALLDRFIDSTTATVGLDEFESLAQDLDETTATQCGLPLVSALVAISTVVETLPCWEPSGVAFPSYVIVDCT